MSVGVDEIALKNADFLLKAACSLSCSIPALSRSLVLNMREMTRTHDLELSCDVAQQFCAFCSQVLIPGVNCSVQLRPDINPKAMISDDINNVLISAASYSSSSPADANLSGDAMQTPKSMRNKPPSLPGSAVGSSSSMKAAKQVAMLTAYRPGTANELVLRCSACERATVISATPRAWRTQQRIKRMRAQQEASIKKKKLEQQLRTTGTPLLQQTSVFGSSLFSPSVSSSSTPKPPTSSSATISDSASSITGKSQSQSLLQTPGNKTTVTTPTTASVTASSATAMPSKPLSLLEQRAKELKAAKKKAQLSASASLPFQSSSFSATPSSSSTSSSQPSTNSNSAPNSFSFIQVATKPSTFSFSSTAATVILPSSQPLSKKPKLGMK